MKTFLTLKEASSLSGKSTMTIRRYALKLLNSKNEKIRANVIVPIDKCKPYKIAKDKVMLKFGIAKDKEDITKDKDRYNKTLTTPMIDLMNKTITTLTGQLEVKDKQIKSLNRRLMESNVLMKQSQLLLERPIEQKKTFLKRIFG